MSPKIRHRNLLKELSLPPSAQKDAHCALQYQKACCKGLGFAISTQGAYAKATICECIKNCQKCYGSGKIVKNAVAINCKTPSTQHVCNQINHAQLPARYAHARVEDFSNPSKELPAQQVIEFVDNWIRIFKQKHEKGLLISGPVGVGKTFLLVGIAKKLLATGLSVKFVDFFQLIALIKASFSENRSGQEIIAPLLDVDVLVIDELGKGRNTDFEVTVLDQLVMGRYNQNKPIIASTNCYLKEENYLRFHNRDLDTKNTGFASNDYGILSARIGERIYSRLAETTDSLELQGDDFRQKKG